MLVEAMESFGGDYISGPIQHTEEFHFSQVCVTNSDNSTESVLVQFDLLSEY